MLPIDKQKEIIKRPLSELTPEDLKKTDLYDYFVSDPTLYDKKKELLRPINNRFKYCGFSLISWSAVVLVYSRNIHYYTSKYFPNLKSKGILSLVIISFCHSFLFIGSFVAMKCLALGINPFTFYKKVSQLNREFENSDPYKDLSTTEFLLLYAEIEHLEEKKAILLVELKEKLANEKKLLSDQTNNKLQY
jgi:hypothetical protein